MKRGATLIILALAAALPASCLIAERNAEAAAEEFCQRFPAGADFAEARRAATSEGDRRIVTVDAITVFFVGLPPFSRHACEIRGMNGKVVARRTFHLD